jgi:hypothetical protein
MTCNECIELNINGMNCHELGCPNIRTWLTCGHCHTRFAASGPIAFGPSDSGRACPSCDPSLSDLSNVH